MNHTNNMKKSFLRKDHNFMSLLVILNRQHKYPFIRKTISIKQEKAPMKNNQSQSIKKIYQYN